MPQADSNHIAQLSQRWPGTSLADEYLLHGESPSLLSAWLWNSKSHSRNGNEVLNLGQFVCRHVDQITRPEVNILARVSLDNRLFLVYVFADDPLTLVLTKDQNFARLD